MSVWSTVIGAYRLEDAKIVEARFSWDETLAQVAGLTEQR